MIKIVKKISQLDLTMNLTTLIRQWLDKRFVRDFDFPKAKKLTVNVNVSNETTLVFT